MAKGIDIAIAADTRSAMSAINRGLIDPLEDVSDALEKLADDSQDATDDLERGMRDAQRRTDDAKDEIRDLRDELNKAGRSGKKTGDDIRDGFRRAEDGAEEFKEEANSTAREAAASFDGSAESIGDAFQEIAANAFAGFGPAGAVAGLAAAAGIGLAMAGFESIQEAEEESKQRVSEWAQAYVEAGGKVLNAATTTAIGLDIATDPDRFKKAQENAKNWGVDVSVAIAAMAGEKWALSAADESLAETERKLAEEMEKTGIQYPDLIDNLTETTLAASHGRTALSEITGEMQRGGEQADAYSRYLAQVAENTAGASTKVDEFGDKVTSLPDGTTIYIDAETGQATTDTDAIEKKIYGIQDKSVTIDALVSDAQRSIDSLAAPRRTTVTVDVVQGGIASAVRQLLK